MVNEDIIDEEGKLCIKVRAIYIGRSDRASNRARLDKDAVSSGSLTHS